MPQTCPATRFVATPPLSPPLCEPNQSRKRNPLTVTVLQRIRLTLSEPSCVRAQCVWCDGGCGAPRTRRQETGADFATLVSARTALGFDGLGQVVLLQIEGKSYQRGVSLYTMAELMIELGVQSAINLDGGGSATGVGVGGVVVSQPSDACGVYGRMVQHCEREVTSVACFR